MKNGNLATLSQVFPVLGDVPETSLELTIRLGGKDQEYWLNKLSESLRREEHLDSLIDWLDQVTIFATTEEFVAKEKFHIDSKQVKFSAIRSNFQNFFLDGGGKIEKPLNEQILRYGKLKRKLTDEAIVKGLGGKAKAKTTLSQLWDLLEKQGNGEVGFLSTDGQIVTFYINDIYDEIRTVHVSWNNDGWCMDARFIEFPNWWYHRHVVSREFTY